MGFLADLLQNVSNGIYSTTGISTPELGLTEKVGGASVAPNHAVLPGQDLTNGTWPGVGSSSVPSTNSIANNAVAATSGGGSSASGGTSSADLAYLDDQAAQLRDLLNRTDVGLNQGLAKNEDDYNTQVGAENAAKDQQYANYADQRVTQNQNKLGAYDTINKNANTGYNSLAQLIGRAAGTGSSAFRELLPNVVGTDTSSKRLDATNTYGQNLQGIDKAQNQYDISFQSVLDDLLKQKKDNENALRSGIEQQRQTLNSQLGTVAGQKAQAQGGGYSQVKAAQQPFQDAINSSRDAVQNFFDQFRTTYTPKQAVAATPDLANYTVDRSAINTQQADPTVDSTNPYAALLKKKAAGAL